MRVPRQLHADVFGWRKNDIGLFVWTVETPLRYAFLYVINLIYHYLLYNFYIAIFNFPIITQTSRICRRYDI